MFDLITSCIQVFGKEVNSANISEGLLIIGVGSQKTAKIRIYSLREILTEKNCLFSASLDMKCDDLGGKVGQYPFGLPLNYKVSHFIYFLTINLIIIEIIVKITKENVPPILFEVKCSEQNLHFGGYPWHYVTNPSNTTGVFEVRSVATNELAVDGRLDVPNSTTQSDSLTFHSDNTGRLVYESGNYINFFKLSAEKNNKIALKQQFELKLTFNETLTNGNPNTVRINGQRNAAKNVCYADKPEVCLYFRVFFEFQ